ncbi:MULTISPECIES: 2-hydroxychromene-2-carboxylate isomerase [Rhodomicrobium]|uniref:2-hydroxychromene-2-carboxylate isomerase n=1 Tax=Rhodomicrobium TaxID=1068 RepID=UPI000B4BCB1F|nr:MULTISPECIES: 2-hydroxychromene-2-carboxylate isomerase [Rhodomicrobium]
MPQLEFWYEFASPYSYLAAMRIEKAAARRGVDVAWKPFLLGPIFQAQGWPDSPFRLYPKKGDYMIRDLERLCGARGLPFKQSPAFPQNGLQAARLATIGVAEGWGPAFSRALFLREFGEAADITDRGVLGSALAAAGQDAEAVMARAQDQAVKDALRARTAAAQALGIFGAPSFLTQDRELFWGDDRLDQALDWAARGAGPTG